MAGICFSDFKVPDLQAYLKERGVSITKINKEKLVALCEAVDRINLPINPDMTGEKTDPMERSRSVFGIDNPFELEGFSSDLSCMPSFSLFDLFNYLVYQTANYDRKKLKAYKSCEDYRLFFDGYVENLMYTEVPEKNICVFKSAIKPTQKDKTYLNKPFYDAWVIVDKQTSEVKMAYCTCIGGADGACRHIGATLYELEAYEVKSVTDGDNMWKKRPRQHDHPVSVKRLKITKAQNPSLSSGRDEGNLENFDPRPMDQRKCYDDEDISSITSDLRKISPNLQILDVLETMNENYEEVVQEKEVYFECVKLSVMKKAERFYDSSSKLLSDEDYDSFINDLKLDQDRVNLIKNSTIGQSSNSLWLELRKGMLTASNFRAVCKAVENEKACPSLLKTLMYQYGEISAPAVLWGQKKENAAMNLYWRVTRKLHKCAKIEKHGLLVAKHMSYIGCSVDGMFSCKCHQSKVLEVKCPYTHRNDHPKDVALLKGCSLENNKLVLLPTSDYYHQVQGQMGLYGVDECDLIIYTCKGIAVVTVNFDISFFDNMIHKLKMFFRNHLVKTIFENI